MTKHLLRSFAGGEVTPELAGRLDLVKYQTGLALCRKLLATMAPSPAAEPGIGRAAPPPPTAAPSVTAP